VAIAEDLDIHLYDAVTDVQGSDGAFTVVTEENTYSTRKVVVASPYSGPK